MGAGRVDGDDTAGHTHFNATLMEMICGKFQLRKNCHYIKNDKWCRRAAKKRKVPEKRREKLPIFDKRSRASRDTGFLSILTGFPDKLTIKVAEKIVGNFEKTT